MDTRVLPVAPVPMGCVIYMGRQGVGVGCG